MNLAVATAAPANWLSICCTLKPISSPSLPWASIQSNTVIKSIDHHHYYLLASIKGGQRAIASIWKQKSISPAAKKPYSLKLVRILVSQAVLRTEELRSISKQAWRSACLASQLMQATLWGSVLVWFTISALWILWLRVRSRRVKVQWDLEWPNSKAKDFLAFRTWSHWSSLNSRVKVNHFGPRILFCLRYWRAESLSICLDRMMRLIVGTKPREICHW